MIADSPLFGLSQRQPPSNPQAEQALLGAMLANNRAYERVAEFLLPEHFADPLNARVYQVITEHILDGRLADAVTLRQAFEHSGVLDEVGGTAYLAQLLSSMVSINSAGEYGHAIRETWLRRQLIDIGETVVNNAFGAEPRMTAVDQINATEQALSELTSQTGHATRIVSGGDAIAAAVARAEEVHRSGVTPGIAFGIPTIDKAVDGLIDAGTLTLLGGLPGSGKTSLIAKMGKSLGMRVVAEALAAGMSSERAQRQPGMLLISMEMSAEDLGLRLAAEEAGMTVDALRKGHLDLENTLRLARAIDATRYMAFRIVDMVGMPFRLLVPKIRMLLQRQPELVVAVDNLMISARDNQGGQGSRGRGADVASVAQATLGLKTLSRQLKVAVIALTHTPRPAKDGTVRRPVASDVKFAGEDDADNVIFVHRPIMLMDSTPPAQGVREGDELFAKRKERWHQDREAAEQVAEIVVAKQRMGPGGVWRMRWDGPTTSLNEWSAPAADMVPGWVTEGET